MRIVPGALLRCLTWYLGLSWVMTRLLGISPDVAMIAAPVITIAGVNIGTWRFYRGFHRRKGTAGQAGLRGPVRGAGPAGPGCSAGHPGCAGSSCSGPGLKYVPGEPLSPGDLRSANLIEALNSASMTPRLYSGPPPKSNVIVSGSGYTRSGFQAPTPAQIRAMFMNQLPPPHSAACQCAACRLGSLTGMPPQYTLPPGPATCTCPSCTSFRQLAQVRPWPAFAPGGIVPSPPAASAIRPRKPRTSWGARGMDGFDGAELVAGTALGYRWWTFKAPALHRNPADAVREWDPGLLHGVKDFWQPGVNLARCQAGLSVPHSFNEIPYDDCGDGFWAYWEIQPHDMGSASSLPVVGVVKASGQVTMGPRGFRAQKAEIIALHLPFNIMPDLAAFRPPYEDSVTRAPRPARRFTGRVISFPGAPPVPPSLGGHPQAYPVSEPPSQEEIQASEDRAVAWMAVIEDRLAVTYPGAEVCATLDLMKAKYPVKSEYVPPERQVRDLGSHLSCPYCGDLIEIGNIHKHLTEKHSF